MTGDYFRTKTGFYLVPGGLLYNLMDEISAGNPFDLNGNRDVWVSDSASQTSLKTSPITRLGFDSSGSIYFCTDGEQVRLFFACALLVAE